MEDGEHFRQVNLGDKPGDNLLLYTVMSADGAIWGTRPAGAFRFFRGKLESLGTRTFFRVISSPDGRRVFGTFSNGISVFEAGKERPLSALGRNLPAHVSAVGCDAQSRLWVAASDGLWRLEGDDFVQVLDTALTPVGLMRFDREGSLWLAYASGGGARYSMAKGRLEPLTGGVGAARFMALAEDREGSFWIATENDGIWRIRDGCFAMLGVSEGLPYPMTNALMQTPDGTFYAATDHGGLYWQRGQETGVITPKEGLAFPAVTSLAVAPDGALWIGLPNGLLQVLRDGQLTTYGSLPELPPTPITQLLFDAQGRLWIGHLNGGLSRLQDGKFISLRGQPDAPRQMVSAAWRDSAGGLWFGTDHGVVRFAHEAFQPMGPAEGVPSALVGAITEARPGEIWIGTDRAGLWRWRGGKFRPAPVGGLPRSIFALAVDDQQRLWISSSDGVSCVKLADLDAFDRGEVREVPRLNFGLKDGLRSLEGRGIVGPTVLRTRDGLIRFATGKGVASVDPRQVGAARQPAAAFVTDVSVDAVTLPAGPALTLRPGWKMLRFNYSALELAAPEKLVFDTRLEGYHPDWIEAGRRREATYTNLAPGEYVFHVRARRTDGAGPGAEASLAFTVEPFFYQTVWFAGLGILVIGATMGGAYLLRLRTIRARNAELERLVAVRMRELEASTASLAKSNGAKDRILAVIGHDLRGPAGSLRALTQILAAEPDRFTGKELGELARGIDQACVAQLDLLNNLLTWGRVQAGDWPMRPEPIPAGQPIETTRHLLGLSAREKNIRLVVEADLTLWVLADEGSVCTILRNLAANAIKFTPAGGEVRMSVSLDGSTVTYRVQDTGVGIAAERLPLLFEPGQRSTPGTQDEKGTGLGLLLCRDLAELNGGRLHLESAVGRGTTALFTLPAAPPPSEG
jgi:signal transduction histidine kinase/ligand-binding sensor domain-containing protein